VHAILNKNHQDSIESESAWGPSPIILSLKFDMLFIKFHQPLIGVIFYFSLKPDMEPEVSSLVFANQGSESRRNGEKMGYNPLMAFQQEQL